MASNCIVVHNNSDNGLEHISTIYLCSKSKLKTQAVNLLFDTLQMFSIHEKQKYRLINKEMPNNLGPEQPMNEGTSDACFARIQYLIGPSLGTIKLFDGDKIIALENGIYTYGEYNKYYDICCLMVYDHTTKKINRYNSFGINIDPELFSTYLNPRFNELMSADQKLGGMKGYNNTFGQYLQRKFHVCADNWMKDPRFGNVDRMTQMKDCCNKYLLDSHTKRSPDYPKPGVIFKHLTSVLVNQYNFDILFSLLERIISDNFDIDQIDFFAGLDARGFWFAPTLARHFKKGFIPIRKASKLPPNAMTKRVKYMTEYSTDEFALEESDEFLPTRGIKKTCVILDDLLATSGSIIAAMNVLMENNINVVGAVTIYDVPELREIASITLKKHNLKYVVVVNENGEPNDFAPLKYKIPECMIKRIEANINNNGMSKFVRAYTLAHDEWINGPPEVDGIIRNVNPNAEIEKFRKVRFIYTEKEKNLADKIFESANMVIPPENLRAGITTGQFSNGETRVQIETSVRDMHVVVISQIRTGRINDDIMELLLILDACIRAGTSKITVVLPYYPYSRSDKKDHPRCPIAAALVAKLLTSCHIDNLISLDLHAGQIQGFIEKGFHNLYIRNYMCDDMFNHYLKFYEKATWNENFILIAPDAGSARAVKCYSKVLGINNVILDKQRDYSKPGTVVNSRIIGSPNDLKNKIGFMIDDMADTFGTMCAAAKELVDYGIKYVIVFVTHGVLSGPAIENINNTPHIKEVIVTDTLSQEHNLIKCPKLRVMTCAELIARSVVDGILNGQSISRLF